MIFSNKLLLSMGLISVLSVYTSYNKQNVDKLSRNKSTDDEDDYIATILVRANEVEVFDQKTNRWITYRNLTRSRASVYFPDKDEQQSQSTYVPQSVDGSSSEVKQPSNSSGKSTSVDFNINLNNTTQLTSEEPKPDYSIVGESEPSTSKRRCLREEYREEYVPGTKNRPGYVRNWIEQVEIPCSKIGTTGEDIDTNDCFEGSVIGGLLGAGLGAALSRKQGRWVGVPVGAAAGALVGCQVDGG